MSKYVRGTIKPLVWYQATLEDGRKQWTTPSETITESHESWPPNQQGYFLFFARKAYPTLEAAKSAAQADCEARILAQIEPEPEAQLERDSINPFAPMEKPGWTDDSPDGYEPDVRCNQCGWHGCDDDLVSSIDTEDGETSRTCPDCGTDNYLMDGPWSNEIHVSDQVKSRVFARSEGYKAGFNAALRSARAEVSVAARDVLSERQRQIDVEGWSDDNDNASRDVYG